MHGNRFTGLGLRVARNNEKQKEIKKARDSYISLRGGATADTIPTKLGRVGEPRDIITPAKFIIVTLVSG